MGSTSLTKIAIDYLFCQWQYSSTCNIIFSLTVLIWVGIVTSEACCLTEVMWFHLHSSWITVDDIKFRSQEKHVKLFWKFDSLLLTKGALYFNAVSSKQVISACRPLFYFSRKATNKNLSLVSSFMKSNFCWQSAETWLPYDLGSIYAKGLALNLKFWFFGPNMLRIGISILKQIKWLPPLNSQYSNILIV